MTTLAAARRSLVIQTARRKPLAWDLVPLRRGSIARDGGALTSIGSALVDRIRQSDPIAAGTLRRYVTEAALRSGEERWCVWLDEHDGPLIDLSPFLRERVDRVLHRRRRGSTAPWQFDEDRQPRQPFFALPAHHPADRALRVTRFDPDTIVNGQVWTLDGEAIVTAGIIESHVFEVWRRVVDVHGRRGARLLTIDVYNSFPCPKLTATQRRAIEEATQDVMLARQHAGAASLDELYGQDQLPRPLQRAHDRLDVAVNRVFGVKAGAGDDEIAAILLDRYRELIASDAA